MLAIQRLSEGIAADVKKVMVQVCPPGRVLMLGATSKRVRELLAHKPVQVAVRVVNDCWLKSVVTGLVQLQGWCSVVTLDLKNFYIPWKAHGLAQALGQCSSLTAVRHRGMGTLLMGTILRFASVPLRKMGTDLLGSWWPCQCVLPTLTS